MARVKVTYSWEDHGWESIRRRVNAGPAANHVNVGLVGEDGQQEHGDSDLTVEEIGLINEFGSDDGHVPARSFLRSTLVWSNRKTVLNQLAQASRRVIFQGSNWAQALVPVGEWGAAEVRKTIAAGVLPANAPETVERKGHGLTLRESFLLSASIDYEINGPDDGET